MQKNNPASSPGDIIAELDALLGTPRTPRPAQDDRRPAIVLSAPTPARPSAGLPSPQPQEPPRADPARQTRRPRILVVDDNNDYRETVRFLLTENGYEVVEAGDGAHGLKIARERRPDLVLLDFNMPQMNGYELAQELRKNDETRDIPLIMFSGSPHKRNLRGTLMDLCEFLEKPVSNARLLQTLNRALAAAPPSPAGSQTTLVPREAERGLELEAGPEDDESDDDDLLVDAPEPEDNGKNDAVEGLEVIANDSPLISRVNKILVRAVAIGASDIHIEPQERELVVRMRVNGALQRVYSMPSALAIRITARLKIMANLIITERRLAQDGQIRAIIKGKKVEFRISCLPSLHGEKIVMRVLGGGKIKGSLVDSGFCPRDQDCIEHALKTPHGLILVTGPTGSGKSTTLYTMIRSVNTPDVNIMTAEDPVEYELPGITQVPVRAKIGLTFESILRSFLRQDPDIMLVGEIRDLETAEISVKAAVTGHLVFSTLHTNSAPATVTRLKHMGLAPYLLAASLKLVIAQRLVRGLCLACRVPTALSDADRRLLTEAEAAPLDNLFRGMGCPECRQTGYKGRLPLFEVMPIRTAEMRQNILESKSADLLAELAVAEGMTSLKQAALAAAAAGRTSLTEALKVMAD